MCIRDRIGFVLLWSTTVPNVAFQLSKAKVQKWLPCRVNYSLGFSKSSIHRSTLAGVSFNSLVRLAERDKWHGRLPLVDAIISICLVSKYSAYWPIYGLNTNDIDFTIGSLNPYEITPPQAIRTMTISRELQLAPENSLHRCAPLVHAVISISFVLTHSTYSVLNYSNMKPVLS